MEPLNKADSSNDEQDKGRIKRPTPRFLKQTTKTKTKAELKDIGSKELIADNGQNVNVMEASVSVSNVTTADQIEYDNVEIDIPFDIAEEVNVQSENEEVYSVYTDPITGRLTVGRHLRQFEGLEAVTSVNSNSNASQPAPIFVVPLRTDREHSPVGLPPIDNEEQPTETANLNSQSFNKKRKRKSTRERPRHRAWTPAAGALDPFVAFLVKVDQQPQESLVNWRNRAWRDWENLREDEKNRFRDAAENEEELLNALLKSVPKPVTTGQGLFVQRNRLEHLSGSDIDCIWRKVPPEFKTALDQAAQTDHNNYKAVLSELLDEDRDP